MRGILINIAVKYLQKDLEAILEAIDKGTVTIIVSDARSTYKEKLIFSLIRFVEEALQKVEGESGQKRRNLKLAYSAIS